MVNPIPSSVQKIWDDWNIRGLMLFSLSLQTILILLSPFRKGTANKLIIILIWSVYLLADWAANFAVGLISDSQRDAPHPSTPSENRHLLAFWPPFLLLHLGGPDTITAFSLEDNELWIRHLLGLGFQAIAAVYVFLLSLPENKLAIPTLLMFLAGIIKYLERTRSLYLASMDKFRDSMLKEPDPGPNYAKLMDDIASKKEGNLPTMVIMLHEQSHHEESNASQTKQKHGSESNGSQTEEKHRSESNLSQTEEKHESESNTIKKSNPGLDDLRVVHFAYHYFKIFKGLIVDLIFSFHERNESRNLFLSLRAEDALRVIEVELNFIYDALYTKVHVVHWQLGYCLRFMSFASVVAALSLFHFKAKKSGFDEFDVRITYTLFLGAVTLEIVAFLMLGFSDWTFAALYHPEDESKLKIIKTRIATAIKWFLVLKRPKWCEIRHEKENYNCNLLATPFLFRRWSGHVSGHNLIRYCLKGRPTNFHKVKNCVHRIIEKFIPGFRGGKIIHTEGRVRHFKSFNYGKANLTEGRVGLIFSFIYGQVTHLFSFIINEVIDCFGLTDFMDEIRYLSHEPLTKELWEFIFAELEKKSCSADNPIVAKEISSSRGDRTLKEKGNLEMVLSPYLTGVAYDESLLLWHIATELLYHTEENVTGKYLEFSKVLSNYMMYLLVMHPAMMSVEAGIGKIRFRDTCAEAKRLFRSKNLGPNDETEACEEILSVNTYVKPAMVKGDKSKSVLFDARMLAQVLIDETNDIEKGAKEDKWELLSKIWVELLSYAACNCIARTHAQQVSKGGELITFVWLLMAHFGIGRQFQINKGQGRTKLIVGK